MPDLEKISKKYEDACFELAQSHAHEHDFPIRIMCFPDPNQSEVRLVEVSDSFPSNAWAAMMLPGKNGTMEPKLAIPVVSLRASDDFLFRSSVALVTEEEWKKIESGVLAVSGHWDAVRPYQIWPNDRIQGTPRTGT